MGQQLFFGQRGVFLHHANLDRFTGHVIRHTNRSRLQHLRMLADHVFDLIRVNVKTGNQNHIFLAIDHAHKARLVNCNDIAGCEPALF
ncbi:hypothetical protein D3C72_2062930 [compost metagenome]